MASVVDSTTCEFQITVLGRTLEHLGVQMYKRRDAAIAELVANCWDAGARNVYIHVPDSDDYDTATSRISITDDGEGMDREQIQRQYLVVGRNRRRDGGDVVGGRPVMGRKGVGKLAGFGIATRMVITTWKGDTSTEFTLDMDQLKQEDGRAEPVKIVGHIAGHPSFARSTNGTHIVMEDLKHVTPLDIDKLRESLSRRFSRRIRGEMTIYVNGDAIGDPSLAIEMRVPETGYITETLSDGSEVKYYYAFTEETIKSSELRGFTVYVRGKTAQAPPFFFNVEATASGQHATRYLTGAIEADFLDASTDDDSDLVSTDRQEIDWEAVRVSEFHQWGDALTRRVLREWTERRGKKLHDWILKDEGIKTRIERLDKTSQKQVSKFLTILGAAEADQERALDLADSLVKAFEYRQFHDVIKHLEDVGDDPEEMHRLLSHLQEWKVLESRAVLEIVKGRLDIIDKFHDMIVNNAPETASKKSKDNMHDLLGGFPWILNPEWQVLSEETAISTQMKEWGYAEITDEDERMRYDFLALSDERRLVIIEIKRSDYAVTLDDLQRLERYKNRLSKANGKELHMVLICGGTLDVDDDIKESWFKRPDARVLRWSDIYEKSRTYYENYRAVLEGNVRHGDFAAKAEELAQTRTVVTPGGTVHRNVAARSAGLGNQDVDYAKAAVPAEAADPSSS